MVAALVFILVVAAEAFSRQRAIARGLLSLRWTHVRARIVKAYVDGYQREDEPVRHRANVRYTYAVNGRVHESTCLTFGQTDDLDYEQALALLDGIVQGREVDAWYDPARPQDAVLLPLVGQHDYRRRTIGFVWLALIPAVVAYNWSK